VTEVECRGCGRVYRVASSVDITVEFDRRADDNYALYALAATDARLSNIHTRIEDVELAHSYTEYWGPTHSFEPGASETIEEPSALGTRISLIHQCVDETAIRMLESLMECPKCGTVFSSESSGEGAVFEEPLRFEWETLYDGRMRAWSVGTQILPDDAPVRRYAVRMPVHECEPDWPDDIKYTSDFDDPDDGGGSHMSAFPHDTPPTGSATAEVDPEQPI
jgi:hypothetical protein